jgi:hypothetical protein
MEQGYSFQRTQSAIRSTAPQSPFPFHQINIEGVGDNINTLQHIPVGTVLFFKDQKTKEGYEINGTYRFDSIYRNVLTMTKYPPREYDFGIINQVQILGTIQPADYRKTSNLQHKVRLKDLDLHSQAIHAIPPMGVLPIGTCITFTEGLLDSDLSDPNPVCELFQEVYKANTFGKSLIGEWVVVANAGVTGAGIVNMKKNSYDMDATLQRHFGQSYMLRKIKNIDRDDENNIVAIGRYAPNEKNSIELRAEHLHELLIRSTHLKDYRHPIMVGMDEQVDALVEKFDYITDSKLLTNEYFNICTELDIIYKDFFSHDRMGGQVYISRPYVIKRDTLLENDFACGLESLLTMTGYQTGDGAKTIKEVYGKSYDSHYWGGAMNQWRYDYIDPSFTNNVSNFTLPISQHEPHKSNEKLEVSGYRSGLTKYVHHSFDYMDNGETKTFYEKKPSEDGFEPLESLFPDDKGCVNYCLSVNSSIFHPFENTLANITTIDETSITGGSFKLKRQSIQYPILWFIQRWLYSTPSVGGAKWAAYQKSPIYLHLMLSGKNPYELNKNCRAETPQDVLSIKEIDCPPLSLVGIINAQQVKMYGVGEREFSESPNQIYSMIAKSALRDD